MEHFGEFLKAIWRDWVGKISGICSVGLATLGSLFSNPLPRYSFWLAAVLCLIVAPFRVFQKEHSARLMAEKMNQDYQRHVQEVALSREKAETEKLERENRLAREEHARTLLDKALLDLLTNNFRELEQQGVFFANFVPTTEWLQNAAKELNCGPQEIFESLGRLKAAGKYSLARALTKGI